MLAVFGIFVRCWINQKKRKREEGHVFCSAGITRPENILINIDGYLKLTDFGFAKVIEYRTSAILRLIQFEKYVDSLGVQRNSEIFDLVNWSFRAGKLRIQGSAWTAPDGSSSRRAAAGRAKLLATKGPTGQLQTPAELVPVRNGPQCGVRAP